MAAERERFMAKVKPGPPESCWEWIAGLNNMGYGTFVAGGTKVLAHRWIYEHSVGPIPDGLQIDHLCRNRRCVNPAHLEPVTPGENTLRGMPYRVWPRRTHCPNGHPYSTDNTRIDSRGHRHCRACDTATTRRRSEDRRIARIARYGYDPGPRSRAVPNPKPWERHADANGHHRWNIDLEAGR